MPKRRSRIVRVVAAVVLAAAVLTAGRGGRAAESGAPPEKTWEFDFLPYMWFPGTFGTIASHGRTAHVDTTVKEGLDLATGGNAFTAAGYFELRHDRVFGYLDGFGGYEELDSSVKVPIKQFPRLGSAGIDARLKLKPAYIDFGIGYRLGEWTLRGLQRALTMGVYVGGRYYFTYTRLRAKVSVARLDVQKAVDVSDTTSLADPLIGFRTEIPLLDSLAFDFRGDIGGFHTGSKLAWNLIGQLRYWPNLMLWSVQPWVVAGYRVLAFDQEIGGVEQDLQTRGPFAGLGLSF